MTEWSVELDVAHQVTPLQVLTDRVDDLLEILVKQAAVASYDASTLSVRLCVSALSVEAAIVLAGRTLVSALRRAKIPVESKVLRAEAQPIEDLARENQRPNTPDLVGVAEVATLLKVTKQRVSKLAQSRDFPRPVVTLASGPIWRRSTVARFASHWPRRAGRRAKAHELALG